MNDEFQVETGRKGYLLYSYDSGLVTVGLLSLTF